MVEKMIRIKPDPRNTNKHTETGMQLLEHSIDKAGVLESISVATDGTIISGHARKEIFDKKGMIAKEIELQENEFAVIKTKIQPNTKEYYEAQILANTTANKNFKLDRELVAEIVEEFDIDIEEVGVEVLETDPEPLKAEEDDFDTTPPETPITVLGDLYEIGRKVWCKNCKTYHNID
jgi:ParB-like chromosome segregation protein Spo0J